MTSRSVCSRRTRRASVAVLVLAGAALVAAAPAQASARFEFIFDSGRINDDNQFFLHRVVAEFGVPRPTLEPVLPRLPRLEDDLPVALFLSKQSGQPLNVIVNLRVGGLPWSQVFERVRVAPDVVVVGIDRDPGPPYGKAWGYGKKHGRRARLSDRDIVGLVGCQMGHRLVGTSPYELARARGQGRTVVATVAEKGGRGRGKGAHGKGHGNSGGGNAGGGNSGGGNAKSSGHGNGKGHGNAPGHGKGHGKG